jgi:hypothetical protein
VVDERVLDAVGLAAGCRAKRVMECRVACGGRFSGPMSRLWTMIPVPRRNSAAADGWALVECSRGSMPRNSTRGVGHLRRYHAQDA